MSIASNRVLVIPRVKQERHTISDILTYRPPLSYHYNDRLYPLPPLPPDLSYLFHNFTTEERTILSTSFSMASRGSNKTATRRRITVESSDGIDTCNRPSSHFPYKLYDMLEYAADSEFFYAVSWSEDGISFAIHDKDEFMMFVVPKFFKQTKFRSFVSILSSSTYHDVYYCNKYLDVYDIVLYSYHLVYSSCTLNHTDASA